MSKHTQTWKSVLSACLVIGGSGALCGQSVSRPSAGPIDLATPTHGSDNCYPGVNAASSVASAGFLAEGALPFVVFAADFNSGNNGFTFVPDPDAPSTNLWHRTAHRFVSPTNCMYYGIEGAWTYATTNLRNAGNLQSPSLSLAGIAAPISLSFDHLLKTEGGTAFDQATVLISTDSGATWTALISTTNLVNPLIQSANFTNLAVDLSAYAGRDIVLRFNVDTVDGLVNNYEGWYLDDVVIRAAASQRILLIEDQTGFDGTAGLLRGLGYPVTEVTNEFANGYATLLDGSFLSGFGLVVYGERGGGRGHKR